MRRGRQKPSRREERTRDAGDREAQEIDRLREENERLRKQLEEQAKRIADLERQLALKHQNSTLTSKPPSSDGLAGQQRPRGRRVKSRRRPGGQPGHHQDVRGHPGRQCGSGAASERSFSSSSWRSSCKFEGVGPHETPRVGVSSSEHLLRVRRALSEGGLRPEKVKLSRSHGMRGKGLRGRDH